jgi:putative hydrolase of HD superfamily
MEEPEDPHRGSVARILAFSTIAEHLKHELRHSWLSDGRRESVAEHTWQMALLLMAVHPHLELPVDLERALKMVIVHDLPEAETGDVPYFETGARMRDKPRLEQVAIERIRDVLGGTTGREIYELWQEYEARATPEAKLVKALDDIEVQVQHNLAPFETWEEIEYDLVYTKMDRWCAHDAFLVRLCEGVRADAEAKMRAAGVDVAAVKQRVADRGLAG